jgi:hypothetical protein
MHNSVGPLSFVAFCDYYVPPCNWHNSTQNVGKMIHDFLVTMLLCVWSLVEGGPINEGGWLLLVFLL